VSESRCGSHKPEGGVEFVAKCISPKGESDFKKCCVFIFCEKHISTAYIR
jgi:hypothetical protein